MSAIDTHEQRRKEFAELWDKIPTDKAGDRVRWLADTLGVSKATVYIWKYKNSVRPIPESKLKLLKLMLK